MPQRLFNEPFADIIYSENGEFLSARVAADSQWRFPETKNVSDKFKHCIVNYEDQRFFSHLGIDVFAVARAIKQNIKNKRIVSGASTITMQLVRLHRKGKPRVFGEKIIEAVIALRLELSYSKDEILALYSSYAPFGGNIVGIEAASWRYFGCPSSLLSWGETATLAVLPNSPALIHPGRNRKDLKTKKDALLKRLSEKGVIDDLTYREALSEEIPKAPKPLPDEAPHLLDYYRKSLQSSPYISTINPSLQKDVKRIGNTYSETYQGNKVNNIAILVAEVNSGKVLAYIGNSESKYAKDVDLIRAERSSGSLLKPILYAAMLQEGEIMPSSLLPDVPLFIDGFAPQNYNKIFHGAVAANEAIKRSLNVPLVRMLIAYNCGRFHELLKTLGVTTLHYSASHYGASLILGGAECTLFDICSVYASLARDYNSSKQSLKNFHPLVTSEYDYDVRNYRNDGDSYLTKGSLWCAFETMSSLNRPEEESDWSSFKTMKKIAWKTGTSYGSRDAWAVGFTPQYIVGVWVGNASGEGRAGLTGIGYAAPVLFDVFSLLKQGEWFAPPYSDIQEAAVCRKSGFLADSFCEEKDTVLVPKSCLISKKCPYHKIILLDQSGNYRVNRSCYVSGEIKEKKWFVLPPIWESYYKYYNPDYESLPPFHPDCIGNDQNQLDIIYPQNGMTIYLPKGFESKKENIVLKAAHLRKNAEVFWYLNELYIGSTKENHEISCSPSPGKYTLKIFDDEGNFKSVRVKIIES
ncbi:MAG: penicillin-binding protein 1C [Bacteroidales bacterium]|nr:penicillin-binding protein 1C [Bacteroidales bacterium]